MRKITALCLAILLLLSGCTQAPDYEKPVTFYYCSSAYQYETGESAIRSEMREGSELSDLNAVMQLYLKGPESDDLVSPFPAGLRLIRYQQDSDTLQLVFSEELSQLTNVSLSMACGCITMTSLALVDVAQVTIAAENSLLDGQKSITMSRDSLILSDQSNDGT